LQARRLRSSRNTIQGITRTKPKFFSI